MVDLLLIVPHPDDEVFGAGGIFSKMAAHGRSTAGLILTRGGAGRSLGLCKQEDLPALREKELRASLEILGVQHVHIWDYPDFLPDNTRGMEHRNGLPDVPFDEAVSNIQNLIDELKPISILTFGPSGSNGHPDHVMTHKFVIAALKQSMHQPEKLYYYAGEKPFSGEARAGFLDPKDVAALHLYPTHFIHVHDYIENKIRAMAQHQTQAFSVLNFMKFYPRRLLIEGFHRAYPVYPVVEGPRTVEWL
jgi:LmbE family N-acetylglucosaminyl deacetylase